jgi:DNA mismatch endonuclease (patch repair protein)
MPKSNTDYWEKKLFRNKTRDMEVNLFYQDKGWFLLRIWEHEIKNNLDATVEKIIKEIKKAQISR